MPSIQNPSKVESIASLSQKALATLSALSQDSTRWAEQQTPSPIPLSFKNEIERLEIWQAEHAVEQGKLDYGLRETSVLRERVTSLLGSCVPKKRENEGKVLPDTLFPLVPGNSRQIEHGENQSNGGQTSSSIDTDISFPDSLPETPLTRAHDIITLLLDLGPTLLDPTPHDKLDNIASLGSAKYDFDHIRAKFPKAATTLVRRLGDANWERRQYFRSLRLSQENDPSHTPVFENIDGALDLDKLPEVASSESDQSSDEELPIAGEGVHDDVDKIFTEDPSTSSAPSLATKSNVRSNFEFSRRGTQSTAASDMPSELFQLEHGFRESTTKYIIPPPPKFKRGFPTDTFLCQYCFYRLSDIKSIAEWRAHVFEDIKPYMCTYTNCPLAGKTYGDKKSWWQHERDRHRIQRVWKCKPCESSACVSEFRTAKSFDDHISEQHSFQLNRTQLHNIRDMCLQVDGILPPNTECPLCKEEIVRMENTDNTSIERAVRKHIANHLEQLAFFVAFPAGELIVKDDDSEFQDDSDSSEDFKSEIQTVISKDIPASKKDVHRAKLQRFIANQEDLTDIPIDGDIRSPLRAKTKPTSFGHGGNPISPRLDAHRKEPTFPIKLLMHPPNEHFYARQELLAEAEKVLTRPGAICIFQGVGGVGKSLAAVEYIYTHQEDFDAIFWLQADTAPGRSDSYHQMTLALGLIAGFEDYNQITNKGRMWLQSTEKRWLLIFDNAIDWSDISVFLPNELRRTNGSVLITTQKKEFCRPSENVTALHLDTLNRAAGSEMLLKYLGRDVKGDQERHLAQEISAFVGGLPVAIAHVAGYLEYSGYSLQELIETFRQWRKRAGFATNEADDLPISFREASLSYDETLAMVWNVTLRELTADANEIMNILACLNCEAIPESMLWGVHEDADLHFLDVREALRRNRNKTSLTKRRLVQTKEVDGEPCLSMHRSLQRGIREGLLADKGKQQKVFDLAVTLVRKVFPPSNPLQQPTPTQWTEVQRLLPHLHALRDVYKSSPTIKGSVDFAQLMTDAGMDQFERGIIKEGLLLLTTAEEVLDAGYPEDQQVMRANIHAMIAIMYDNTGITQRQEGFERRKTALEIRRKIFNDAATPQRKDEILLYNSEMEYAISLLHYHKYQEAEPIIEKCLDKFREWGPESEIPFEYAKYYNKIALVRLYQGRFDEAIKLASRGVALMEKTGYALFESRFKFDLACIILQSGDLNRALQVHREILDQRVEKLGQLNELTLHSAYAIGAIYELKGDLREAEAWFRKCITQRRSFTSWPEEAFARAQFHMSQVLQAKGNPEDAETIQSLREKSLRVLNRLLPLDMPDELKDVQDESVLFDHMLPVSPGGSRFTGRDLLPYFMGKK